MASIPFLYTDFHGGFNSKDAPDLLTDNEARDVNNVQGTTAGAIVKRAGHVTFAAPLSPLSSLYAVEATTNPFLIGVGDGVMYSFNTSGAHTTIAPGLDKKARWEFVQAPVVSGQGPVFGMNGVDTPQQWSGTGNTVAWTNASGGTAVPNGKYCIVHQNQVFAAGVAGQPSRLYWSAIADPTNWDPASLTGAGFMDFDPNDGEAITGIGVVGPYVLVGKPRKLFILTDPATATSRSLSSNVGVASHRSIAAAPEGTYFLAEDRNVYLTNGSKVTAIADKIQPTVDKAFDRTIACGTYFNAHYYLSLPLSSTWNDTTLDYDVTLQSWWKHDFGSNGFAVWHPTGKAQLYSAKQGGPDESIYGGGGVYADGADQSLWGGGSPLSYVDQCFVPGVSTDNGLPMSWAWRGPWQSPTFYRRRRFPTPYFEKRLRQARFDGSGTVNLYLAQNFEDGEALLKQDMFNFFDSADTFAGTGVYGDADATVYGAGNPTGAQKRARLYGMGAFGVAYADSIVFGATSPNPAMVNSYVLMLTDRRNLVVS